MKKITTWSLSARFAYSMWHFSFIRRDTAIPVYI